jgi:hypothetical protein
MKCENKSDTSNNRGKWNYLSESWRKYPRNILTKHKIKELQTAILGTVHTYFGKYNVKVQNLYERK